MIKFAVIYKDKDDKSDKKAGTEKDGNLGEWDVFLDISIFDKSYIQGNLTLSNYSAIPLI